MPDQTQDSGQPVPAPAGGEVDRFDPDYAGDMFENSGGSWVRYEDYEKLKEFVRDVCRTLGQDLHSGEGFNKELFHRWSKELLNPTHPPRKFS